MTITPTGWIQRAFGDPSRKDTDNGTDRGTEEDSSDSGADEGAQAPAGPLNAFAFSAITPTREDPSEPVDQLEVVQSTMPILAKREALLSLTTDMTLPFGTVTSKGTFGVVAKAYCLRENTFTYGWAGGGGGSGIRPRSVATVQTEYQHPRSETPGLNCTCGFYAVPSDASLHGYSSGGAVVLQVELYGKVIEHDLGYRAEYQKVMECQIPPCLYCGRCADYVLMDEPLVCGFVCAAHQTKLRRGTLYLDVDSLPHRLGVPVTRLELPEVGQTSS